MVFRNKPRKYIGKAYRPHHALTIYVPIPSTIVQTEYFLRSIGGNPNHILNKRIPFSKGYELAGIFVDGKIYLLDRRGRLVKVLEGDDEILNFVRHVRAYTIIWAYEE